MARTRLATRALRAADRESLRDKDDYALACYGCTFNWLTPAQKEQVSPALASGVNPVVHVAVSMAASASADPTRFPLFWLEAHRAPEALNSAGLQTQVLITC
eukprot:10889-Pelagomonas_calceolata.AAC.3